MKGLYFIGDVLTFLVYCSKTLDFYYSTNIFLFLGRYPHLTVCTKDVERHPAKLKRGQVRHRQIQHLH